MPVVVILAFALAPGSGSGSGPGGPKADATTAVSVPATTPSTQAVEPCAQVLSALPVQLDGYNPRRVYPYPDDSAAVVAWGNPPIILQCGVARPPELDANSSATVIKVDAVNWLPVGDAKTTVFTAVDRAVYIAVTVPKSYQQPPLATLADAIASVLPAICHFPDDETSSAPATGSSSNGAPGPLCTRRS